MLLSLVTLAGCGGSWSPGNRAGSWALAWMVRRRRTSTPAGWDFAPARAPDSGGGSRPGELEFLLRASLGVGQVRRVYSPWPPIIVPTRPIPQEDGLPAGRFFVADPPDSVVWNVKLEDAAGHTVPFTNF